MHRPRATHLQFTINSWKVEDPYVAWRVTFHYTYGGRLTTGCSSKKTQKPLTQAIIAQISTQNLNQFKLGKGGWIGLP